AHRKVKPWYQWPRENRRREGASSSRSSQAVVIGGGIAGCTVAGALARQGWQVTLIERGSRIALKASGNPAAVMMPFLTAHSSVAGRLSMAAFLRLTSQIETFRKEGHSIRGQTCGVLQLPWERMPRERLFAIFENHRFPGDFAEWMNADRIREVLGIRLREDQEGLFL